MITVSLCMIVKNEERILQRCLDSVTDLVDEIIIVDTGSTDKTKEIASRYTKKVYDFAWIHDFAAARNFAFSKANCDYIYSADADEVIDEDNRIKFRQLKETLVPEVEIVQMYYGNQLSFGTIYNYDKEYRPKLFKRLREFTWIDPIHETIRTAPVVFDSEIEITHLPEQNHAPRDLAAFQRAIQKKEILSARLNTIYAKELFVTGEDSDFLNAEDYYTQIALSSDSTLDMVKEAACVIARAARIRQDIAKFYKYAMKDVASEGCSEVCCELGQYYQDAGDYQEAIIWYYNAAYETASILNVHYMKDIPFHALAACYEQLGMPEQALEYEQLAISACEETGKPL